MAPPQDPCDAVCRPDFVPGGCRARKRLQERRPEGGLRTSKSEVRRRRLRRRRRRRRRQPGRAA
eukprot:6724958-Pyramimonas_sp.AAC.1